MAQNPELFLERIYLKDVSFESPRSPDVFAENWRPRVQLDLNSRSDKLGDDRYEVVLTATVETRDDSDRAGFIVEVQQAGVFRVRGLDEEPLKRLLSTFCPATLFPYAREVVDSMVVKGGFPALTLAPVNFDALYEQALQQQREQATADSEDATRH
jgi:preprotein translocase subunit SecB